MASPPDLERPGAVDAVDWADRHSPEWAADADYVDKVYEALKQNGFTEKTIIDPAFGGWSEHKTIEHDRQTFHRLREFRAFGRPILVSINRKNFLRSVAGRSTEEALPVSLAATSMAVERGADVIRTHDVAATRDAAVIGHEFSPHRPETGEEITVREIDTPTTRETKRRLDALGGDPDRAAEFVARTVVVEGLDVNQRAALESAANTTGVVCSGDQHLLVGGIEATFDACVDDLERTGNRSLAAALRSTLQ